MIAIRQETFKATGAVDIMAHVKILQKPDVRERNNIPEAD
jgi:hypothetical protein